MHERMDYLKRIRPVSILKAALYVILIGAIYHTAIRYLVVSDWARDDYSYCYLIPIVILYVIWEKLEVLAALPSSPTWRGFIPFVFGLFIYWLGELGGEYFTMYVSLWFILVGLLWMHLGWGKIKTMGFALLIFLTMFPFPNFINTKVQVSLRLISSQIGVALIQTVGMSAYREGNIIDLGFTQLQVVDACSGLRYLIPLIILGILLAYFYKEALWKRIVIVFSTIPLSILTNAFRIGLTGILHETYGSKIAEGFFHGFSGWFIFMGSVGVLVLEMWILKGIGHKKEKAINATYRVSDEIQDVSLDKEHMPESSFMEKPSKIRKYTKQPQFIVAALLLGITLVLSNAIDFREKIPIKQSFDSFPIQINQWMGTRQYMDKEFIEKLDLNDYAIIDFEEKSGKQVNFYVAYYESQRKGESIHSPATCLPGGGWFFKKAGKWDLNIASSKDEFLHVNRAFMEKGPYKQLVYYWFPQRGRILTNAYQLKIFNFWDALTKHRTDGALVRLVTPLYETEKIQDAEARLQNFVKDILPVLSDFLPE